MSQSVFSSINPASTSGNQLATILNDFKNAIMSGLSGTSRPAQTTAGGAWIDTTNAGAPNFYWSYKIYDGTTDIEVFRVNLSSGTVSIGNADSTFSVTKISADSAGPLLKLVKSRVAGSGQDLIGDVIGDIQFVGNDNTGAKPIVARIKVVGLDDMIATETGAYMAFEAVAVDTATLAEVMRVINGRVGIGLVAPENALHVRGNAIRSERVADDATAAKVIIRKKRATGLGGTLNADSIGAIEINTTDSTAGTEVVSASLEAIAVEAHTSTARGTRLDVAVVKTGGTAKTVQLKIGDDIESVALHTLNALKLVSQDIATAATIAALNADKAIVNFTGAIATSVQGLSATGLSKTVLIHNGSTATVTIEHENGTATAANRFKLPKNKAIALLANQSAEFYYSTTDTRWVLKSGSGGGGEIVVLASAITLAGGGTITPSTVDAEQVIVVSGNAAPVVLSNTPFGSFAGTDPMRLTLIGVDDDNTVTLNLNDATYGCIIENGADSIDISKSRPAKAFWLPSTQRFYVSRGV